MLAYYKMLVKPHRSLKTHFVYDTITGMSKSKETKKSWDISKITRDAVVGTAARARILQDKAAEELKKAAERVKQKLS